MMFVVFDLDGTLADDTHRQHFLELEPKDWDAYFAACADDPIIEPIAATMRAMIDGGHWVEVWTGRSAKYWGATKRWLAQHQLEPRKLRMRPESDFRPDVELKMGWMDRHGHPALMFDDRTKSVAFWREQGIICCQVAQHDY